MMPPLSFPHAAAPLRETRRAPAHVRGFTLIEIMVVIAILVVLMALLVAVGSGVISSSKGRQTHATLNSVNKILDQYLAAGNPEPSVPTPWPYSSMAPAYVPTNPASDPINWVKMLRADPTAAKLMATIPTSTDPNGNTVVLDAWGTPIRYVPYNASTKKSGYFWSAGQDGQFLTPPPTTLPPDDLYSTDPM